MSDGLVERLKWRIEELRDQNNDLKAENARLREKLDDANYRIRNELEPRIQADNRRYDRWATSPERGM